MHAAITAAAVLLAAAHAPAAQDTRAVLDELARRYAELPTYHARIVQTQFTDGPKDRPAASSMQSWSYDLAFDRAAERITLRAPWGDHAQDADTYVITCMNCGVFESLPAEPLSLDALTRENHEHASYTFSLPTLDLLLADTDHEYSHTSGLMPVGQPERRTVDGTAYTVVRATLPYEPATKWGEEPEAEHRGPAEYWIDEQTGLLKRVTVDFTDAMRGYFAEANGGEIPDSYADIASFRAAWDIQTLAAGSPIDDDAFEISTHGLEPGDGGSANDAADGEFSSAEGARFIHQPAPAFTATTLDGQTVSSDSLKGKAVLIDFWATWCGPCVAAMPAIQKVADKYADEGLVVLGVNQDRTGGRELVESFLEEHDIAFDQILDPDDTLGTLFGVSAIPTTILIDREGIVQAYAVGFHGGAAYDDAARQLLDGEPFPMPEPPESPADSIETIEKIALSTGSWPAPVTAWEGRPVTTAAGPGYVMPHDAGGLARLDDTTGGLIRIPLKGVPDDVSIIAFAPVEDRHGGWIVALDSATGYDDLAISRVGETGVRWTAKLGVDPDIEPMYEADIVPINIDADDDTEFLVAVGVTDSIEWEVSVLLLVLESNGEIVYRKPLPLEGFGAVHHVPGSSGRPDTVYVFGINRVVRVSLDM